MTNKQYVKAVESNLKGLEAVSTGVCPGCETCATEHGFTIDEFTEAYETDVLLAYAQCFYYGEG